MIVNKTKDDYNLVTSVGMIGIVVIVAILKTF